MPIGKVSEPGSYPGCHWVRYPLSVLYMVYVAQLVECLIVVQEVMGSTPIIHTTYLRSIMEMPQNTNLMIVSSNLTEGTKDDKKRRMTDVERRVAKVHTKNR